MTEPLDRREFLIRAAAGAFLSQPYGRLLTQAASQRAERRDRAWLDRYLNQAVAGTSRNRRYLAVINRSFDHNQRALDTAWLQNGGAGGNPRRQMNLIGKLAFCYRTSSLRGYRDPHLLEALRLAFLAVAQHITPAGRFDWPGYLENYDARPGAAWPEHAWKLESLLLGYLWVGDGFPLEDRRIIESALQRATTWHVEHPNVEPNNRGVVHCAVSQLCALFFDRSDYADAARRNAGRVISGVVFADGECGEHNTAYAGGGPDSQYSYTSWAYLYLYRLLSGDARLDGKLLRACGWFSMFHTFSGCPTAVGASVRRSIVHSPAYADLLPAFERYARHDPFFATLAEKALDKIERTSVGFWESLHQWGVGGHITSPFIWALLEGGQETQIRTPPDWYANFTALYQRPQVHYALVGRQYQTGVVLRGRGKGATTLPGDEHDVPLGGFPLRGMQCFAFGDEFPILFHTDTTNSSTQADGVDTATTDAERGPNGWEVVWAKGRRAQSARGDLHTLATRQGTLWTLYAYTPVAAVVVYGGADGPITSRWVVNLAYVPSPNLDQDRRALVFDRLRGRISYLHGQSRLFPEDGGLLFTALGRTAPCPTQVLEVVADSVSAFAFSDSSFAFEGYDSGLQELRFADGSGRYVLLLRGMVTQAGDLARDSFFRLRERPNKRLQPTARLSSMKDLRNERAAAEAQR